VFRWYGGVPIPQCNNTTENSSIDFILVDTDCSPLANWISANVFDTPFDRGLVDRSSADGLCVDGVDTSSINRLVDDSNDGSSSDNIDTSSIDQLANEIITVSVDRLTDMS
jgi:hypothetical protein